MVLILILAHSFSSSRDRQGRVPVCPVETSVAGLVSWEVWKDSSFSAQPLTHKSGQISSDWTADGA